MGQVAKDLAHGWRGLWLYVPGGRVVAGPYERLKTATVSAWLVCGNMSTIASDSMR